MQGGGTNVRIQCAKNTDHNKTVFGCGLRQFGVMRSDRKGRIGRVTLERAENFRGFFG